MKFRMALLLILVLSLSIGSTNAVDDNKSESEKIMDHLHKIFKAFMQQDWDTVRNTHSEDWTGFKLQSTELVRGIEGYMTGYGARGGRMVDYEIRDSEVQIYDNIALVYYIGTMTVQGPTGQKTVVPIRSLDVYRKDENGWIQSGSHIGYVTSPELVQEFAKILARKAAAKTK